MGHSKQINLKTSKGQTLVEYILLMSVIASITVSILNNSTLRSFVKGDGDFFTSLRKYMSYNYRHASPSTGAAEDFDYGSSARHNSYYNKQKSLGRFFYSLGKYND